MASFVYNTICNNVSVPCEFKFYHYNTNKLSSLRYTTADNQIVFDTDDADINNQDNPFKLNDKGLLFANTTINDIDYFAMIIITSTGGDVYTGTINLKESFAPTLQFVTNSPSVCLVNNNITVLVTSSDEYQWIYNGVTHYHKNTYYGKTIFPKVGIKKTEYKLIDTGSEVYQTSNIFNKSISKEYTLYARVFNNYDQVQEITKTCFLYLDTISANITHDTFNPVSKQSFNLNININTIDNNFVNLKLVKIENNVETDLVTSTNLSTVVQDIEQVYKNTISYKLYYTYFNGIDNIILTKLYNVNMKLKQSELALVSSIDPLENDNDGDEDWNIVPTIIYGDGLFQSLKYQVYFKTPFSEDNVLVATYIKTDINSLDLKLTFKQNGSYTIVGTLTDEFQGISSAETIINISSSGLVIQAKSKPIQDIVFDRE